MKLCLFSVSYAGLWGQKQLDLDAFIAKAGKLGYDSVMLAGKRPHLSPLEATPQRIAQIKRALARAKVTCPVLGGYTDFAGFAASEVPSLEMQIAYVESLCRIAAQLHEHPVVRIFTAYDSGPMRLTWDKTIACVQESCDRAAAWGVTIAVQNHHDLALHTDALLEFLTSVDRSNCKLGFDAWSPAARGENLYEAAKKAAPHTAITTNADYVCLPAFKYDANRTNYNPAGAFLRAVPFGRGFIDYPAYWRGLVDGGFKGILTYEMCSPLRGGGGEANLDKCAKSYLTWMQSHATELGLK
jgi:sugar phosphate isomerase/epimerase